MKKNPFIGNMRTISLDFSNKESDVDKIKNHIQGKVL